MCFSLNEMHSVSGLGIICVNKKHGLNYDGPLEGSVGKGDHRGRKRSNRKRGGQS